jgi:ADP-ribosylglycohydrolase
MSTRFVHLVSGYSHFFKEAIDGAFIQAAAVAELCKVADPLSVDRVALVSKLAASAKTTIVKEKLQLILNFYKEHEEVSEKDYKPFTLN